MFTFFGFRKRSGFPTSALDENQVASPSLGKIITEKENKLQSVFEELNTLVCLDGEWDIPHCKDVCEATRKVLYRYTNLLNAYELFYLRHDEEWKERLTERITSTQIVNLFDVALGKIRDDPYRKNIRERKEDILHYDAKDYKAADTIA